MLDRRFLRLKAFSFSLLASLVLAACATPKTEDIPQLRTFSSEEFHANTEPPQCKALLDSYCNYLYSPEVSGNLEIRKSGSPIKVLQGETPNQFSQVFFTYAKAKLKNQNFLPKDFYGVLTKHNYFGKLSEFLSRKPFHSMTLSDRLEVEQTDFELGMIWSASINETIILRMNRKSPGYYKISKKLIPVELSLEENRVRRNLISEISKAIWNGNDNWKKVETTFTKLKASYLTLIDKLDSSEGLKKNWKDRINSVRLVLPGSMPSVSSDECSSTTVNAFYYTYLNVITVCAGDFNSEDILQTLAHELGHVLDTERSKYIYEDQSKIGAVLKDLRKDVCTPDAFSCEDWNEFVKNYDENLDSLDSYSTDLVEFQRCLKRRPTTKSLTAQDVKRLASSIATDRISNLASGDRFLRITKSTIPMPNGKVQKNPNYLNPCNYYLWSQGEEPVDDDLTTLMFFTASYRCSNKPAEIKLRESIELAKDMTTKILEKTIKMEGEFSGRDRLESEGFSSPPTERFADVVGSYAMAEFLSKIPATWERRNKLLAGVSWLCQEPSIASSYPNESSVEKEFVFDSHTEGEERRKEIFSTPIREIISCEKDFQFNECKLPLKD
jgi:hypothetical protein